MAAMRVPAIMEYDWRLVALSVVLGIVGSLVALLLAFRFRQGKKTGRRKILSALVMGSAIPLMHYTGMWAVQFRATNISPDATLAVSRSGLGATAITIVTLVVLSGGRLCWGSTRANATRSSRPSGRGSLRGPDVWGS